MLADVNVLVAAYRADHPYHKTAAAWLKEQLKHLGAGQGLTLTAQLLGSFLRLVTHPKIFADPAPCEHAIEFADWLLEDPKVQLVAAGNEWPQLRQLVLDKQLAGNHVPDAKLAALAISLGEPLATFDKGFRRLLPRSLLVLLPLE
jgi:uncharacterized protein